MTRCPCGFVAPGPLHFRGPGSCRYETEYYARLRASANMLRLDAIRAACVVEGRGPTVTEWRELKGMIN